MSNAAFTYTIFFDADDARTDTTYAAHAIEGTEPGRYATTPIFAGRDNDYRSIKNLLRGSFDAVNPRPVGMIRALDGRVMKWNAAGQTVAV